MGYRALASVAGWVGLTALALLMCVPIAGQTPTSTTTTTPSGPWTLPRTAWGHPDLQGVWTTDAEVSVPLERPREFGERAFLTDAELAERSEREKKLSRDDPAERDPLRLGPVGDGPEHWFEWAKQPSARTSLIVDPPDGRMPPWTSHAQTRAVDGRRVVGYGGGAGSQGKGPFNGPEDLSLADRCVTRGLPTTWFPQVYNNGFQIVQSREYVAILYERLHEARVIPLDGRSHLTKKIRQWMGDSRGRWEGDTLVVDVTNFSDKTNFGRSEETLQLTERYTRVDAETVKVEVTIIDPTTWTRPWTVAVIGKIDPRYSMIYEYACHEGNYSLANILKAARAQENAAKEEAGTGQPVFTAGDLDKAMKAIGRNVELANTAIASKDFNSAKVRVARAREQLAPTVSFWENDKKADAIKMVRDATARLDDLDSALSARPIDANALTTAALEVDAACQACHAAYREQDPATKTFRLKPRSAVVLPR